MKKEILIWVGIVVVFVALLFGIVAIDNASKNKGKTLTEEVQKTDWIKGPDNAKVTIVEYSDFQCPACYDYYFAVKRMMEKYGDRVRFVYRNFPLPQHENATPAAKYANAAGKQGKFWEMYDIIFQKQKVWSAMKTPEAVLAFQGYGKDLGLDVDKLTKDSELPEIEDSINHSLSTGRDTKLEGTPTFFINGKMIANPASDAEFESIIKNALEE
jgi:protein-disulfide isomerase